MPQSVKRLIIVVVFCLLSANFLSTNLLSANLSGTKNTSCPSGQFFILTLPNFQTLKEFGTWLEKTRPAGVMLIPAHVKNRQQTKKLCNFLQSEAKKLGIYPLLICIDWEGGIVSRPTEVGGFTSIPSPYNLAKSGKSNCFLAAQLIAKQMRDVGINVDFAPSLDLFDPKNPVLATRCFGPTPEVVEECGIAFAKGLMSYGINPVIKHYPGLMLGKGDTHFDQIQINASKREFDYNEKPFLNAIQQEIPAIMVSHAQYKQFGALPASRSVSVVKRLKKLNPNLIIITDDIAMQAYHNGKDLSNAVLESINNGFDLIIYSATPEKQIELVADINKQIKLNKNNPNFAKKNLIKLKQDLIKTKKIDLNLDEKNLAVELAQKAVTQKVNFLDFSNKNTVLISVDYTKIRPAEILVDTDPSIQICFANSLGTSGLNMPSRGECAHSARIEPSPKGRRAEVQGKQTQFAALLKKAQRNLTQSKTTKTNLTEFILDPKSDQSSNKLQEFIESGALDSTDYIIVQTFFYGDGIWNKIQTAWLEQLKPYADKITVLSLGHPFEKLIISPAQIIELGSFSIPMLNAAIRRLNTNPLLTGADQLAQNPEAFLKNKKFGVLCHKCSVVNLDNKTEFLPDFLYRWSKNQIKNTDNSAKFCALFAPEHGILGTNQAGDLVKSENSSKWECPIYSLHGTTKCPTPEMLKNLDLLIIDFQEVGVRCYTYLSTLALTLQAAKNCNIPVLILERPNPIKFWGSFGPDLNPEFESFLGKVPTHFGHGLTVGEIAENLNKKNNESGIGANPAVLKCDPAYESPESIDIYFSSNFIPPSPNLPTIESVYVYPITVFIEGTNYSEGRGTTHPFEQIGAPWIDAKKLAANLNGKKLPGIYFEPISFTPKIIPGKADNPKHKNTLCNGVFLHIYNRKKIKPFLTAQAILKELFQTYPKQSEWIKSGNRYFIDLLAGNDSTRKIAKN